MLQMSRQDDFQLRLAQWILDQLKTVKELEAVTQQFSLLVTQTQEQSIGDLYAHIGGLILERTNRVQSEDSKDDIHLCAELCYYLLAIHFEQRSDISARVILVHEHLFCLCIDSLSTGNNVELAKTHSSEASTRSGETPPWSDNEIAIEKNSELLFHLFKFQLISLAQISQYIFRVISSHEASIDTRLSNAVVGVRLLVGLFPRSHGPWKKELDSFNKWIGTHSTLDENKANAGLDDVTQSNEPDDIPTKGQTTDDQIPASPLCNVSDDPLNLLDAPVNSNKTPHLSQSQVYEEEEMDDTVGNNAGKPPRTPSTSRVESPVEAFSEEERLSTNVATSAERQKMSSGASVKSTENVLKDTKGSAPWSSITISNDATNPLSPTASSSLGPAAGFNSPPTPPRLSISSSHTSPSIAIAPLQIPQVSSPSSSNDNAVPNNLHRVTNRVQINGAGEETSTLEYQVQSSPKFTSTEIEERANGRPPKGQEEKEKEIREKEERARKEREKIEESKQDREEAERKAEEERKADVASGGKELQVAKRKSIGEAKQETKQDRVAREKAERKAEKRRVREEAKRKEDELRAALEAEREDNERKAKEEEDRKAREEAEHRAQVDKMREDMERMAKREAELKAKREEERKEQERKEMERMAKEEEERRVQVVKIRQEMERMAKKEAELKLKREAEHKAIVDKMREDMERMASREAEIKARREEKRQAREEEERKAREEAERKELERRAKKAEEDRRQAERKAKRIAERQSKKEGKRKVLRIGTTPYAESEAPPQWGPAEYYYSPPNEYDPYMGWVGSSQNQYSFMPQTSQFVPLFSLQHPTTRPRPPSPSLSNFPPLS
ncbi:hypothetical protein ACGC1H_005044 [Rhizoctonia solani]